MGRRVPGSMRVHGLSGLETPLFAGELAGAAFLGATDGAGVHGECSCYRNEKGPVREAQWADWSVAVR